MDKLEKCVCCAYQKRRNVTKVGRPTEKRTFRCPRGKTAGLKCRSQVTGQVTGYRPQATGQVTGQVTGHRSGYRPQVRSQVTQKTIGHWTKLFWSDVLLYKNKITQGTLMIFCPLNNIKFHTWNNIFMLIIRHIQTS